MNSINILGVKFNLTDQSKVLDQIEDFIASGKFHYIVTPNPEIVLLAQKDSKYRHILNSSDISIADGLGIILAAKFLRHPTPSRVQGTDLFINFLPIAQKKQYKIYLLGGAPNIALKTKKFIESKYPNIQIVGAQSGPTFQSNNPEQLDEIFSKTIADINSSNADILFVAFGAPKQELFIHYFKDKLNVKVAIGIGGAFDYVSDTIKRAPGWLRAIGFEWFYRLFTQPHRIKRILRAVFVFPYLVIFHRNSKEAV